MGVVYGLVHSKELSHHSIISIVARVIVLKACKMYFLAYFIHLMKISLLKIKRRENVFFMISVVTWLCNSTLPVGTYTG